MTSGGDAMVAAGTGLAARPADHKSGWRLHVRRTANTISDGPRNRALGGASLCLSSQSCRGRQTPGQLRVEWFDDEGRRELEIFTGRDGSPLVRLCASGYAPLAAVESSLGYNA